MAHSGAGCVNIGLKFNPREGGHDVNVTGLWMEGIAKAFSSVLGMDAKNIQASLV